MNVKYQLRKGFNGLVALIPRKILSGFLRSFEERPDLAEVAGYNVYPRVFYSPFLLFEEIDFWAVERRRDWLQIDFRENEAIALLRHLARYTSELDSIPYEHPDEPCSYWFNNQSFTDFDAAALYTILRHNKPKRYIELGCGFSSYISSLALAKNAAEGRPCEAVYADPEPRRDLAQMPLAGKLLRKRVQDLPLELFQKLDAGDALFVDTSHVVKLQSDVVRELIEILPALKSGVIIHIHDVFSPYDYPLDWVQKKLRLTCNEQYAVECLLLGGNNYRVLLPLHLLWRERREVLRMMFPRGKEQAQSFWIIKN